MEDRVKLTADDSDYQNVMRRAGQTADKFTNKIEHSSNAFTNLFKRTPGRRAELAISNLTGSLASGDIGGAIASFAGRLTGLGLAAGVGIGVAAELFEKFHASIKDTSADTEALKKELSKPAATIVGLSPEGIEEQANKLKNIYDKMVADHATFTNKVARTFTNFIPGESERSQDREEQAGLDRLRFLQNAGGKSLLESAQASRTDAGDSTKTALDEVFFKARQSEAAIRLASGLGEGQEGPLEEGTVAKLKAVTIEEERLTDQIVHRSEVRQRENEFAERQLQFEEKLQRAGESITEEKKKQLRLVGELDQINAALADPATTADEREGLRLKKHQAENDLRGTSPRSKNPFPFGTFASRDFESQFGFRGTIREGIEQSLAFGGFAKRAIDNGEALTPEEALLKTGTSAADIAAFKKNVGDLPGSSGLQQDVVGAVQHLESQLLKVWQP